MKTLFNTLISLILFVSMHSALAESKTTDAKTPKPAPKDRYEMMTDRMGLTAEQKKSLKPILEKLKQERAETMSQLEAKENKELSKILNPKQAQQVQRILQRSAQPGKKGAKMNKKGMKQKKQTEPYPRPPKTLEKK